MKSCRVEGLGFRMKPRSRQDARPRIDPRFLAFSDWLRSADLFTSAL